MKSHLLFLFLCSVLALALVACGVTFDPVDCLAVGFVVLLTAWCLAGYSRPPRSLNPDRPSPIRFPGNSGKDSGRQLWRKAA